jgi:uncharacterized protein YciI
MYVVQFEDDPSRQTVRDEHQQSHEHYLQQCGENVVNAGVLRRESSNTAVGGLWIVRANSELEVRAMIEADPFFIYELRRTIKVWEISPDPPIS